MGNATKIAGKLNIISVGDSSCNTTSGIMSLLYCKIILGNIIVRFRCGLFINVSISIYSSKWLLSRDNHVKSVYRNYTVVVSHRPDPTYYDKDKLIQLPLDIWYNIH